MKLVYHDLLFKHHVYKQQLDTILSPLVSHNIYLCRFYLCR